jgi:hypothetical protein
MVGRACGVAAWGDLRHAQSFTFAAAVVDVPQNNLSGLSV